MTIYVKQRLPIRALNNLVLPPDLFEHSPCHSVCIFAHFDRCPGSQAAPGLPPVEFSLNPQQDHRLQGRSPPDESKSLHWWICAIIGMTNIMKQSLQICFPQLRAAVTHILNSPQEFVA